MGLAVSQIRLLALTTRKADIELEMTIDSKRKQMLTRKSTQLSQDYYSRLQNTRIQYATSNGYEDITYAYLMGAQGADGSIATDFWQQIATGSSEGYAQKTGNNMILTDQYGQVILCDELAIAVEKTKDAYSGSGMSVSQLTCATIWSIIEDNAAKSGAGSAMYAIYNAFKDLASTAGGMDELIEFMDLMLNNGGYMDGGTVYVEDTYSSSSTTSGSSHRSILGSSSRSSSTSVTSSELTNFYSSSECTDINRISLQAGYCYSVYTSSGSIATLDGVNVSGNFYDGSVFVEGFDRTLAKYLGNLISYLGPMLSSAIQNGTSTTFVTDTSGARNTADARGRYTDCYNGKKLKDGFSTDGTKWYYTDPSTGVETSGYLGDGTVIYEYEIDDNSKYTSAMNTDNLQAGLKSGAYQLCYVSNVAKGMYKKNTTLDYFINMNYVVEKTDSSEREELTAWYNAELASISEQETYWDDEITNLSTELTSINTEIDSVKSLKSDAIKSVFDWGSK